jgi:hypothetical protein
MVDLQIIPEPPVAFGRVLHVHLLQLVSYPLIFFLPR